MSFWTKLVEFGVGRPRLVTWGMIGLTVVLTALAVAPSVAPSMFPMFHAVKVDTDPENMLSAHEEVRVFHNKMKKALSLHDMIVVGVVNDKHPQGVFNPTSLEHIYELTQYAKTLQGERIGAKDPNAGVIAADVIAPSTVDNIEQAGPGIVRFEWLMADPPETDAEAQAIRDKAQRIPFLDGTLVSEDGKAIALYLPLTSKDLSYKVYRKLNEKTAELENDGNGDAYYITGLPVAEDTFGVEMFVQMAISAPLAMLVIFLLMLYFFRKLVLIISPMIVAVVTVIITMALLVATGNTIHIMSSMIPIFIMPIAVLNSIHILSEFFDRYQETRDRRKTITHVMHTLFVPMLYTSLTTTAGFASLALTPIPPVQVFGIFNAIGVMFSWLLTVTFVPAYVMLLPDRWLEGFGAARSGAPDGEVRPATLTGRFLQWIGLTTYHRAKAVLALSVVAVAIAVAGISMIRINDNPTKWFRKSHPIRVADRVLNAHFGGTYMAYLAFAPEGEEPPGTVFEEGPSGNSNARRKEDGGPSLPYGLGGEETGPALPAGLGGDVAEEAPQLPAGLGGSLEAVSVAPMPESSVPEKAEVFKDPLVLRYIEDLQKHLLTTDVVGKSNSLTDIVMTVHRELKDGSEKHYVVPDTASGVAQTLMQYQSSHRPQDLWHFVTPDYRHTSVWVQLKSGNNVDANRMVAAVAEYVEDHPPVFDIEGQQVTLEPDWFGLTYINIVWQEKMVKGMLQSFLGSFLVVLLMMTILFRSGLWGLLSMVPLTITIGLIYGVIGLIGKDYDMPVAVLSSLTLGLAVDFAIHFLARSRVIYETHGSWQATWPHAFAEPGPAIARNVIVIAVGFLPLLFAPLVPYNTVGVFLASILFVSGGATLLILPALIRYMEPLLFPSTVGVAFSCKCATCIVASVSAIGLVALNVRQFLEIAWTNLAWASLITLFILAGICHLMSRRSICEKITEE